MSNPWRSVIRHQDCQFAFRGECTWIWMTLIIHNVGENKPLITVKEDVVVIASFLQTSAANLERLHWLISLNHYLFFVIHIFSVCMIPSAHNPAVLSLVDSAFCCILPRLALFSPRRVRDVPDNSFSPRLLSSRHTFRTAPAAMISVLDVR